VVDQELIQEFMQVLNLVREVRAVVVQEEQILEVVKVQMEQQAQATQEAVVVEVLELNRL